MTNIEILDDKERKYITKEQDTKIYNHEVYIKADTGEGVQVINLSTREKGDFSKSLDKENIEALIVTTKEEKLSFDDFIDKCCGLDHVELEVFSCWDF